MGFFLAWRTFVSLIALRLAKLNFSCMVGGLAYFIFVCQGRRGRGGVYCQFHTLYVLGLSGQPHILLISYLKTKQIFLYSISLFSYIDKEKKYKMLAR